MTEQLWYQYKLSRGSERMTTWLDGLVDVGKYVTLKDDGNGRWKVDTRSGQGMPKDQISAHRKARFASL